MAKGVCISSARTQGPAIASHCFAKPRSDSLASGDPAAVWGKDSVTSLIGDFKTQLSAIRKVPARIADGSDIELWMVCNAYFTVGAGDAKGTFFIHGLFFAHDPEPEYWTSPGKRLFLTGTRNREYQPNNPDPKQWVRTPTP